MSKKKPAGQCKKVGRPSQAERELKKESNSFTIEFLIRSYFLRDANLVAAG